MQIFINAAYHCIAFFLSWWCKVAHKKPKIRPEQTICYLCTALRIEQMVSCSQQSSSVPCWQIAIHNSEQLRSVLGRESVVHIVCKADGRLFTTVMFCSKQRVSGSQQSFCVQGRRLAVHNSHVLFQTESQWFPTVILCARQTFSCSQQECSVPGKESSLHNSHVLCSADSLRFTTAVFCFKSVWQYHILPRADSHLLAKLTFCAEQSAFWQAKILTH